MKDPSVTLLTTVFTVAASIIVLAVDLNHREELDVLITIFTILPQLFILDVCVIAFAIYDRRVSLLTKVQNIE